MPSSGPEPAASAWRSETAIRSRFDTVEGIYTCLPDRDVVPVTDASCVTIHNTDNVVAIGSRFGAAEPVQILKVGHTFDTPVALRKGGSVFDTPDVESLSWHGNELLVSNSHGSVFAYPLNPGDLAASHKKTATYKHSMSKAASFRPGRWPDTDAVRAVAHCPADPAMFLSLYNNHVYLWNKTNESAPVQNLKVDKAPLHAGAWCPQSPNLYCVAGGQRSVSVLDSRQFSRMSKPSPVWLQPFAHAAMVRDVSWSPLVPHWISTASDDGHCLIWDLRYGASPVATLAQHRGKVTSVSWCPTHADLVLTGSQDGSAKLWNLSLPPRCCVATITDNAGLTESLCGVGWSPQTPLQAFAVGEDGATVGIRFTQDFVATIAPSKYEPDSLEREAEVLFYARELEEALSQITTMAARHQKGKRYGKALALAEMSVPRQCPTTFTFSTDDARPEVFAEEVASFGYYLPPNLPPSLAEQIPEDLFTRMSLRLVNLRVLAWTPEHGVTPEVDEIERSMFEQLENDYTSIDNTTVLTFLQSLIAHDVIRCLDFGLRYAEMLAKVGNFDQFAPVAHLLLYPTIYDSSISGTSPSIDIPSVTRTKSAKALSQHLANQAVVFSQLKLVRDVTSALTKAGPSAEVIDCVGDRQLILSSFVCRVYFEALISLQRFDQFYIPATAISRLVESYPFAEELTDMLNGTAFTHLRSLILDAQVKPIDAPWDKKRLKKALLISANILQNCAYLPPMLSTSLPRMFGQLVKTVSSALTELQREPTKPGKKSGEVQAQKYAEGVLDQLKIIRRDRSQSKTGHEPEIQDCLAMLKKFCP